MQAVRDLVQSPTGRPIAGATVTVTYTEGGAAASLYAANEATPIVGNVLTTNANGEFEFYTFNGRYTLTIVAGGYGSTTREITLDDPEDYAIVSLKKFGLMVEGSNNTTAIQAALTAAEADKLCIAVPPGTWEATQLSSGGNYRVIGVDPASCVLKQRSSTNAHFWTLEYGQTPHPIIENLTIDGNRTGNTTSGHALYLEDHAETDSSVTYGGAVVLRNSYIQNAREDCLHVGVNRNMGHIENTELKRGGRCMYVKDASDWRAFHGRFAFPLTTHAIEIETGADNVFLGGAAYGATAAACVRIKTQSTSPTKLIGMTINFNDREGLHISGASGIARGIAHVVNGCWFAENSLLTDNTYAHIKLEDISNVCMTNNVFRWLGTGNRPSYLVEMAGVTGDQEWTGNSWNKVTLPYGTAVTNTAFRLYSAMQGLKVDGDIRFGTHTGSADAAISGYITVFDAAGNSRKLAVIS